MKEEKASCRLLGVFIGRSSPSLLLTQKKPSGSVSRVTTTFQGASRPPLSDGDCMRLSWLMAGLEEETRSQSSVCRDVTPHLSVFEPLLTKHLEFLMERAPAIKQDSLYHFVGY